MSINNLVRARFGQPTDTGSTVADNDTVATILARRSHRAYRTDAVPPDLLDTLFATAFSAPSKSDLQQACVVHVQDKSKQQRIADGSPGLHWIAQAPVFLVWCGDSRRIRRAADYRGHPFANDHLDAFMNAAVDAGICMQTFIIAAESYKLGCCPVSEVRNNIALLSQELQLPDYVFPVAGLCVGWPLQQNDISMRLPLTTTVKVDHYSDDKLLAEVDDYDRRRTAAEGKKDPGRQLYVEDYGVAAEYGWSEHRTRQYSRPARADFGRYIRKQGFDLG